MRNGSREKCEHLILMKNIRYKDNITTTIIQQSIFDDNKDIIWPTVVGIFVALALGWMICRYKCSSIERSPHIVQCCPKSLCKKIRLCCIYIFNLCRFKKQSEQHSAPDLRMAKGRPSNNSILEISSNPLTQQWPRSSLLNNNQRLSFPLSPINLTQPKRHPLRRDSILYQSEQNMEKRDSTSWPFQTTNIDFHKPTNEIKKTHLLFNI